MFKCGNGPEKIECEMNGLHSQFKSTIVKLERRRPFWRRVIRMPIKQTLIYSWNLLMLFHIFLPLNITSRLWGWVNALNLPVWLRSPMYRLYSWVYHCDLDDLLNPDLTTYSNLSEFFRRALKPQCRPIDIKNSLVSPVDGKVISIGPVHATQLHDVKGISYTLKGFLGPINWDNSGSLDSSIVQFSSFVEKDYRNMKSSDRNRSNATDGENASFIDVLKQHPANKLFHCTIYLSPGDYHKFHSPADWTVFFRRHFPGKLFSVNPLFTSWIKNLFCLNERAVYIGNWRYGFFSFTAVGANNVGSISVCCDPLLQTNKPTSRLLRGVIRGWHIISRSKSNSVPKLQQRYYDNKFSSKLQGNSKTGIQITKGDLFGEFNFGSTIVMIFEAPADFQFSVELNDIVKFGQALGRVVND